MRRVRVSGATVEESCCLKRRAPGRRAAKKHGGGILTPPSSMAPALSLCGTAALGCGRCAIDGVMMEDDEGVHKERVTTKRTGKVSISPRSEGLPALSPCLPYSCASPS